MAHYSLSDGTWIKHTRPSKMDTDNPNRGFKRRKWLDQKGSKNPCEEVVLTKGYVDREVDGEVKFDARGNPYVERIDSESGVKYIHYTDKLAIKEEVQVDSHGNSYVEKVDLSSGALYLSYLSRDTGKVILDEEASCLLKLYVRNVAVKA